MKNVLFGRLVACVAACALVACSKGAEGPVATSVVVTPAGQLTFASINRTRKLAAKVLDQPDLADDARYAHNALRVEHRAELDEIIAAWAAGRTLAEGRAAAEAAGLGNARLNSPTEVLAHPQLAERGRWCEFGSPVGPLVGLLPPPETDDWEWRMDPVPALGEHTEPILRELGFGAGDIEGMRADQVI